MVEWGTRLGQALAGVAAIAALALLVGCAHTSMKGTPFYTGEYEGRTGPAEDRVNLWPLMYYREPALSVLWPIFELTEDHLAVRPIYSVYGLHREDSNRTYNFLWPLGQVDQEARTWRFFPVWGSETGFNVFPLYWHEGEPIAERDGYDVLFPLWAYVRHGDNVDLHLLWPIYRHQDDTQGQGWRLWPFYGDFTSYGKRHRYVLWPLGHHWQRTDESWTAHALLPLYYYTTETGEEFFSLPYSFSQDREGNGWQLILPVMYREFSPDRSLLITPLYAAGRQGEERWHLVVPLYYRNSLTGTFASAIWARWGDEEAGGWVLPPAMAWQIHDEQGSRTMVLLGLAGGFTEESTSGHWVIPLYYRETPGIFYSPLLGWRQTGDTPFLYPLTPLFGLFRGERPGAWLFPLFSYRRGEEPGTAAGTFFVWGTFHWEQDQGGSALFPFWDYQNHGPFTTNLETPGKRGTELRILLLAHHRNIMTVARPAIFSKNLPFEQAGVATHDRSWGIWPLFDYHCQETEATGHEKTDMSLLLWLYDSQHVVDTPPATASGETPEASDYLRRRVLWRVWHYEKSDEAVSVDMLPGITWDSRPDGFRQFSLLWRFFRYESGPRGRKLDLLFLPLLRSTTPPVDS